MRAWKLQPYAAMPTVSHGPLAVTAATAREPGLSPPNASSCHAWLAQQAAAETSLLPAF